jgi:hypothetical protein
MNSEVCLIKMSQDKIQFYDSVGISKRYGLLELMVYRVVLCAAYCEDCELTVFRNN